jgi:hypothetical protein
MAKYQMKRLLDAREADVLQHQTPLTVQDLESYAENTASQLLYLQLAAAGEVGGVGKHRLRFAAGQRRQVVQSLNGLEMLH